MVTDRQVRRLMELLATGMRLGLAAAKAGMDEKTARKYRSLGKMPHEVRVEHSWRTREDPFDEYWAGVSAAGDVAKVSNNSWLKNSKSCCFCSSIC